MRRNNQTLTSLFKVIPPVVCSIGAVFLLSSCADRTALLDSNQPLVKTTGGANGGTVSHVEESSKPLHIWFVKTNQEQLQLVSVDRANADQDPLTVAIKQLLDGPTDKEATAGLASEIPRGTILLGIKKIGNDFEVNVSHRFAVNSGASSMETRISQLSKTVAEAAGVHKVYLAVEGQRLNETPGDGLEVKQPLN